MEPEKPKFNRQRMLITAGFVLLAALIVGGTTWYVMDKSAKEIKTANDQSVAALQKQIDDMKAAKTTSTKLGNTSENSTKTSDWHILRNTTYGFQITYPENWKGVAVQTSSVDGSSQVYTFYLPTTDSNWTNNYPDGNWMVSELSVFSKAQWNLQPTSGPRPIEIARNANYVFAAMGPSAGPTDNAGRSGKDIYNTMTTF